MTPVLQILHIQIFSPAAKDPRTESSIFLTIKTCIFSSSLDNTAIVCMNSTEPLISCRAQTHFYLNSLIIFS